MGFKVVSKISSILLVLLVACADEPSPKNQESTGARPTSQHTSGALAAEMDADDPCMEGPILEVDPPRGSVGDRVTLSGTCFKRNWDAGFGVFLIRQFQEPRECELLAGGRYAFHVQKDGGAKGYFVVPERGSCSQRTYGRRVTPGQYWMGVGCHACTDGVRFRVIRD